MLIFLSHNMLELSQMARGIGLDVWGAIASFHAIATSCVAPRNVKVFCLRALPPGGWWRRLDSMRADRHDRPSEVDLAYSERDVTGVLRAWSAGTAGSCSPSRQR